MNNENKEEPQEKNTNNQSLNTITSSIKIQSENKLQSENSPSKNKLNISIDNILELIKNKKNIILTCPKCKKYPPLITDISNQKVSFKCLCSSTEISMELEEFILNIEHLNSQNEKCFKHKEQIATFFCKECQKFLCDICENYHSSFEPNHKVEEQILN